MKHTIILDDIDMQTLNDCLVSAPIPYQRTGRLMQNINRQLQAESSPDDPKENEAAYTHK